MPTVIYSPFLNSSPHDLARVLGQVSVPTSKEDDEWFAELRLFVDGRLFHTSGQMTSKGLFAYYRVVVIPNRKKTSVKARLLVTRNRGGFPSSSDVPVQDFPSAPSNDGFSRFVMNGSSRQVSRSMQTARSRVTNSDKRVRVRTPWQHLPKPVRPSPEIINRQFLKIAEVGNRGTLQPAQSGTSVVPTLAYSRSWTGTRTPGFGSKAVRQLPVNPHTVAIDEVSDNVYTMYSVNQDTGDHSLNHTTFSEIYGHTGTLVDPEPEGKADAMAIKRLVQKAQLGIESNVAQSMAQFGQINGMVAETATKFYRSFQQLRRGNISGAADTLTSGRRVRERFPGKKPPKSKDIASEWLALQYGWKPLLKDIETTLKNLPNLTSPEGFVQRVTSSATARSELHFDYPNGDSVIGENNTGHLTLVNSTSVKYGISYRLDDAATQFFAQAGFTNPINLAWEVLPFSFVVDWFLPVGQYLEMLSAFHGLTFLDGYRTRFTKVRTDSSHGYSGPNQGAPQTQVLFSCHYKREKIVMSRQRLTAFPGPVKPSFNLNPFKNSGISAGTDNRAANAIALLGTVFR